MILVDTSVVIDYTRSGDAKMLALFQTHSAAICGVTRAEVLAGVRSPQHRGRLVAALNSFFALPILEAGWDQIGDYLLALRTAGVTVPFADVVIAAVAIAHDVELWTRDAQFVLIQRVLPQLKLFQEPP
jgi:predicted nucleic acid-binding protein